MNIRLRENEPDKPVWSLDKNGSFNLASTWHLFRQREQKSWINFKTWHKKVPIKICFIVWRALRNKIPIDDRVFRFGIPIQSRCFCCGSLGAETLDHLFCSGTFAKDLWKSLCGPLEIGYSNNTYRQIMINWWKHKTANPVTSFITVSFPIIATWEIWRSRCGTKYGTEKPNVERSLSLIAYPLSQLITNQFSKVKLNSSCYAITTLLSSAIQYKTTFFL